MAVEEAREWIVRRQTGGRASMNGLVAITGVSGPISAFSREEASRQSEL
jgi:hypothetical protein